METNHDCGCASAFGRIEALVDGLLSPNEAADVRGHCSTCDSCGAELDVVESLTLRFRAALAEPPPTEFRETIFSQLKIDVNFRAHN